MLTPDTKRATSLSASYKCEGESLCRSHKPAAAPTSRSTRRFALSLVITTIVLVVIVEAALQIVLFIGAGRIENRSRRDDVIATQASRNAHWFLSAGVFITFGSMFAGFTPFEMGSTLLIAFLLAEIVKYGSQLVYYRRPA